MMSNSEQQRQEIFIVSYWGKDASIVGVFTTTRKAVSYLRNYAIMELPDNHNSNWCDYSLRELLKRANLDLKVDIEVVDDPEATITGKFSGLETILKADEKESFK